MSAENLNQMQLCFSEWKKDSNKGFGKFPKGFGVISSSFDMVIFWGLINLKFFFKQKRLEMIEAHYDKSLSNFEQLKTDLDNLDKHLEFEGNLFQRFLNLSTSYSQFFGTF